MTAHDVLKSHSTKTIFTRSFPSIKVRVLRTCDVPAKEKKHYSKRNRDLNVKGVNIVISLAMLKPTTVPRPYLKNPVLFSFLVNFNTHILSFWCCRFPMLTCFCEGLRRYYTNKQNTSETNRC